MGAFCVFDYDEQASLGAVPADVYPIPDEAPEDTRHECARTLLRWAIVALVEAGQASREEVARILELEQAGELPGYEHAVTLGAARSLASELLRWFRASHDKHTFPIWDCKRCTDALSARK